MSSRQQKLSLVGESPAAVAVHDKRKWLSLFSSDGIVNDPVGSDLHQGSEELGRFYDTFIAPNEVVFHPKHDIVCGAAVMRDLELEIRMTDRVILTVPMHLRYELTDDDRVRGLYAHWELPTMVAQFGSKGPWALPSALRLAARLLKNQGVSGSLGFARGFKRVGAAGKRQAATFLDAVTDSSVSGLAGFADVTVTYGAQQLASPAALRGLEGWTSSKFISAGDYVTVSLSDGGDGHAVAMCEFAEGRLTDVTVYVEE
ncbi:nuclear transport factor 2 family protein [Gordonia zhaorongruii]|uniref:nuclear transport factor 2 family protein n=1 Tax=Gordonia zhaorongruii TaxID=2597659 RepID=UPI001050562E|nr:nuclear transport factor 2 family protein [Gordonia zhaorongruii]